MFANDLTFAEKSLMSVFYDQVGKCCAEICVKHSMLNTHSRGSTSETKQFCLEGEKGDKNSVN